MSITQSDIERAYGPGGTEGTNYTVTLTQTNDVHFCAVTDNDNSNARVVYGRGPNQNAACKQAAEGEPLSLKDNIDEAARIRLRTVAIRTSGALVIDAAAGDHQHATLTGDVTSVSVINPPGAGFAQVLNLILVQSTGGYTLPVADWTGVDWWKPTGVPVMPLLNRQTLLVQLYANGDVPLVVGDWSNNG